MSDFVETFTYFYQIPYPKNVKVWTKLNNFLLNIIFDPILTLFLHRTLIELIHRYDNNRVITTSLINLSKTTFGASTNVCLQILPSGWVNLQLVILPSDLQGLQITWPFLHCIILFPQNFWQSPHVNKAIKSSEMNKLTLRQEKMHFLYVLNFFRFFWNWLKKNWCYLRLQERFHVKKFHCF